MKPCKKCKEVKNLDCFYKRKATKDGLEIYCKTCTNKRNAEYSKKNPEILANGRRAYVKRNPDKVKEKKLRWKLNNPQRHKELQKISGLKRRYGMSIDSYNQLLIKQDHKCAICSINQEDLGRPLSVDHDHKTGSVRSLLCQPCNVSLGFIKDRASVAIKMAQYLKEHGCNL